MRSYKDELKQGLDNLHLDISIRNAYLAEDFFKSMKSQEYRSLRGCIYCNFYLNEFLCSRPLSELKEFKKAVSVYNQNHNINSKNDSISIDYIIVCDTVDLQYLIRSQYECDQTIYDTIKSYIRNKELMSRIYQHESASDVGATLIAVYKQIFEEYEEKLQINQISYNKLERILKSAFGNSWVEELSCYIGCDTSTIYKWKENNNVPASAIFDAQTIIKRKIEELQILEKNLIS